jgi:hypothetical protein
LCNKFNGSDFNKEKENTLLPFSTTKDCASLFEDQDSGGESFYFPRKKKKATQKSVKKE